VPRLKPTPLPEIAVAIEDAAWLAALSDLPWRARRAARQALKAAVAEGWRPEGGAVPAMTLAFADDTLVRRLNRLYRGKDKPTNVLSFISGDPVPGARSGRVHLGDVVLALGVVSREAVAQRKALADHVSHLVMHGVLHLIGYDHERPREAVVMEALERRALAAIGVADPYIL